MAIIKCKMCGGDLQIMADASIAKCEYCGRLQTVPKADDEKKLTLFARANRLRAACEFDKAAGVYEAIIADFPEEAEAYWGLVLCKYGIEYVDDPATGKKIPTCHRTSFASVLDDGDFGQALAYADTPASKLYREEAEQLEQLRENIIAVSVNEEPYDIFICYKETNENGDRTLDSVLAQDIYDALTENGYRVFFSRITLEDKLGLEYEPYIFAALNSAKIMLVVGTSNANYSAVWVQNEWNRFLTLMTADRDKYLIPCFKNLEPEEMPEEFARLQSQDLGKIGAIQDLLRGIEKLLPRQQEAMPTAEHIAPLLERVMLCLENEEWERADALCEQVLNLDPKNVKAYLGKLLAEMQVKKQEDLQYCTRSFEDDSNYKNLMRFADPNLKKTFSRYIAKVKANKASKRMAKQNIIAIIVGVCIVIGVAVSAFIPPKGLPEEAQEQMDKRYESYYQNAVTLEKKEDFAQAAIWYGQAGDYKDAKEKSMLLWNRIAQRHTVAVGYRYTIGLKNDGTVIADGHYKDESQCAVSDWTGIISVSAGYAHTVGLKKDGTVVATGSNAKNQCAVGDWTDIVAISAGYDHTVGLKKDGTVVTTRDTPADAPIKDWKDIIAVSAGEGVTVGLKANGTVVEVGYATDFAVDWTDIVAVSAGGSHIVGLKANGTVVAGGNNTFKQCDVFGWTDIVAISAGSEHTLGLKWDGTVVAVGEYYGGCAVSEWKNIVAISAGCSGSVGVQRNGEVLAAGKVSTPENWPTIQTGKN